MLNFKNFKAFAETTTSKQSIQGIDVFFNYLKKYMQACLKGDSETAKKLIMKAGRVICDLNSKCHKETGDYFLTQVINIYDQKQLEEIIGMILLSIIKDEQMLKNANVHVFYKVI